MATQLYSSVCWTKSEQPAKRKGFVGRQNVGQDSGTTQAAMGAQSFSVTTRDIPTTCIARFRVASRRALTTACTSREPDLRLQRADEHVTDNLVHVRETLILIFVSMSGVLVLFFCMLLPRLS
jgi:hypothetical protein